MFLLFCLLSITSGGSVQFPWLPEADYLVNFVWGNDTSFDSYQFAPTHSEFITTITLHHVTQLNYAIDLDDIESYNFTINYRYFQFFGRLQDSCIIFILLTASFQETLLAIHQSGFSRSDHVLFFIKTQEINTNNSLIYSFTNELFQSEVEPFHAGLVFFDDKTKFPCYGVFCYFCESTLHFVDNVSFLNVLLLSNHLNSRGHGRKVLTSNNMLSISKECVIPLQKLKLRRPLYDAYLSCFTPLPVVFSDLQLEANITYVYADNSNKISNDYRWFLQIKMGEAAYLSLPNEIAFTRGTHWIIDETPFNVMACVHKHSLSSFDFTLRDLFPLAVVVAVAMVIFVYSWIYQDVSFGIDMMWPFFGLHHLSHDHPRKIFGFTMIPISIFFCVYDAFICTDCMHIANFPTLHDLVGQKYRLWVPDDSTSQNTIAIILAPNYSPIVAPMLKILGGETHLIDFFHNSGDKIKELELIHVIELMASKKILVYSMDVIELLMCLGKVDKFIQRKYICHVFDIVVDAPLPVSLPLGARVWGYMSQRVAWLLSKVSEIGLYEHGKSFMLYLRQRRISGLQVIDANTFMEPEPTSVDQSLVGIAAFYLMGVGMILLLIFVWGHVRRHKNDFWRLVNISKLRVKFGYWRMLRDCNLCKRRLSTKMSPK